MNVNSSIKPSGRVITSISLAVVAVLSVALTGFARGNTGRTGGGHAIGHILLAGKSDDEIKQLLQQLADGQSRANLILHLPVDSGIKKHWKISAHDLGLGIDVDKSFAGIDHANETGMLASLKSWMNHTAQSRLSVIAAVDQNVLKAVLKQLSKSVSRAPKNARLIFLPAGGFGTRHEIPGMKLDVDASSDAVVKAWNSFIQDSPAPSPSVPDNSTAAPPASAAAPAGNPAGSTSLEIELVTKPSLPRVTAADLSKIDGELGKFSTRFGGTGASRGRNIQLAAGKINGTILLPSEVFSYNKTVGPRVESAGFENAPVIIHGELVPGVGGGICQVSSTLYNAVLLSDLKIVNRSHHAFPVHYLPAGRDATVVDGAIDFKFENNTPAPVYIAASSHRGRLLFRLFGKSTTGREISIALEDHTTQPTFLEKRSDPNMPAGRSVVKDKGHKGHRLKVYRVVKENGVVVRHELISRDRYKPFPKIVIVGTGIHRSAAPSRTITPDTPQSALPGSTQTSQRLQ